MAFRFRRSIKLGKGMRMNVSKRGVGMSFGTRGLRQTFHSTGSKTQSIGIPGTGLSYVNRKQASRKHSKSGTRRQRDVSQNEAAVNEYNQYIHTITNLHLHTPEAIDWEAVRAKPAPFHPEKIGPQEKAAAEEYHAYEPNFLERIVKPLMHKKRETLEQAIHDARQHDIADYEQWEKQTELAENVLKGEQNAYKKVIEESSALAEAKKNGISLSVPYKGVVEAELHLVPKDIVPKKKITLTKTGRLSKRKMRKTDYYAILKDYVSSYTISVARALFARLPVESCLIHVTENVLNTITGHRRNKVLLSIHIDKQALEGLNIAHINPSDALNNFHHRIKHLKTKGFRPIKRLKTIEEK